MPTADDLRKKFFAPISKPAQRTTIARMGKPSPDYGFGPAKKPELLDQALKSIKAMPTGPGGFKGSAGDARSQTRRIKQANALANILSTAANTQMVQQGATARTRMGEIGADKRAEMAQTGQTFRERLSQQGQDRRTTQKEAGSLERTKLTESGEASRQALRSSTASAINQRNIEQKNKTLSEKIRQYDETKKREAIKAMMAPDDIGSEPLTLDEALDRYDREKDLFAAGSSGERRNLRQLQQIDQMNPEERANFDRMTPEQKKAYLQ